MKSKVFLEDLIHSFSKNIHEVKPIGSESLGRLKEWIGERIVLNGEPLPDEFDDLFLELQSIWQYGSIASMDAQDAAVYGALWFGASLLNDARSNDERKLEFEGLSEQVRKSLKFMLALKAMGRYPGIKHGELAQNCDLDKSGLSQLFSRSKGERLYRTSSIGREKYYYLTDLGKTLLEQFVEKSISDTLHNTKNENLPETNYSSEKPKAEMKVNYILHFEKCLSDKPEQSFNLDEFESKSLSKYHKFSPFDINNFVTNIAIVHDTDDNYPIQIGAERIKAYAR